MIAWKFPSNNYGEVMGVDNPGIQTFRGDPLLSLAREVNQNSLDAADHESGRPVEVHFTLEEKEADFFPGRDKFKEVLQSCHEYWATNKKAKIFFDQAISTLDAPRIKVLKISDFYTTGLRGSDRIKGSDWANLIKAVGASDKEGGAGGSFGIGKHASFVCTPLRTVFYSTLDIDGNQALQGVSKLVAHEDAGEITQGTGYYGKVDRNEPISAVEEIPEPFRRTRVGTDLFIFGFEDGEAWKEKIIQSVLENFFVAIHEHRLIVVVDGTRIDNMSLPDLMREHFSDDGANSDCAKYYEAFTSDDSKFHPLGDFEGLGEVELHILPGHKFPKRIAMVRQTGMLVFYKGHFQTPMKFAGVMRAKGEKINELLRSLENPSHNSWEVERHEDPAYAKRIVQKLYAWMRDCVRKTSQEGGVESEYDFEGMQQYLPDDVDEEEQTKPSDSEGLKTEPQEVELVIRNTKKAAQPGAHQPSEESGGENGGGTASTDPGDSEGGGSTKSEGGNAGAAGGGPGTGGTAEKDGGSGAPTRADVRLKNIRAFCSNPSAGEYRVLFQPEKSGEGFIQLRIIGEVEESIAPVASASCGGVPVAVGKGGVIGPFSFQEGSRQELSVILANQFHCALEVAAYENQ